MLHLGHNNPMQQYSLGEERLENSLVGKDLGVLVNSWLKGASSVSSWPRRLTLHQK